MEKKYSIAERIMGDTPAFFKRAQIFGLSLAALGAALAQIAGVPEKLTTCLISSGTAIAAIAQFAVKQCEPANAGFEKAKLMSRLGNEMINQAGGQLGVTELTGHNDGPAVESYLRSVGLGKGYPWCMAFVYWCAKKAAVKLGLVNPLKCTGGVLDEWQSSRGTRIDAPEPGCQFFMHHANGYHTGVVTGVFSNGVLHTIEGNTNSNGSREGTAVLRKIRYVKDMLGFKRFNDKLLTVAA